MKVFACSDQHFCHRNIIKYANRPFDIDDENCVIDNAKLMIERHNQVVTNNDYVLIVGDLSAALRGRYEVLTNIIKSLNGRKILIKGNHDHCDDKFYLDAGFISVVDNLIIGDTFICHYPCFKSKWNKGKEPYHIKILESTDCTKIIHGHVHNKDPSLWEDDGYTRQNVCVDFTANDFYPQELTDPKIKEYLDCQYKE